MSHARPLVSVLIPCFNARPWIEATIASVEAQTWRPLEIVVVDDGSTDGSGEWLQAQADAGRLRLQRQANAGQPAALNAALRLARGEYVQFLDADDLLDRDKIERQMERLEGRGDAVATAAWARFRGDDPARAEFVPEPCWRDLAPRDWLAAAWHDGGGMLFPGLWLAPRALLERAGPWSEDLSLNNDADYFVRVLLQADAVLFCPQARVRYRSQVPGSMSSRTGAAAMQAHQRALARIEAELGPHLGHAGLRRGLSLVWQRLARFAHPYAPAIADEAVRRARALDAVRLPLEGGWRFRLLSALLGWRLARRVQVWSGRT